MQGDVVTVQFHFTYEGERYGFKVKGEESGFSINGKEVYVELPSDKTEKLLNSLFEVVEKNRMMKCGRFLNGR